ncbi:uncharacterized protein BX664DRAFT_385881 [Halteromyces radiatus]|uniref:uncharacterized protein n=1 Tax=Halteromyces radiatus TaxID=101107 RepID=UPI00221E84A9|nr:uncharacterized protein BX664DRAFT_385881 [Halteromyces radiatus]KAI8089384.1 hypothetical protein BX664DRAFT_385881 [Halteromyces radiatus]
MDVKSSNYSSTSGPVKVRPSWLLANNPSLAFSSFVTADSPTHRPSASSSSSSFNTSIIKSNVPLVGKPIDDDQQRTRSTLRLTRSSLMDNKANTTSNKTTYDSTPTTTTFDTDFPTLVDSPITKTSTTPTTMNIRIEQHEQVWNDAKVIQHRVKSPARLSTDENNHDDGDGNNSHLGMEIERLKALVPKKHLQQQHHLQQRQQYGSKQSLSHGHRSSSIKNSFSSSMQTATSTPSQGRQMNSIAPLSQQTNIALTRRTIEGPSSFAKGHKQQHIAQKYDDNGIPSSPSSNIGRTSVESTTMISPCKTAVTEQDQIRFYLFLKRWTSCDMTISWTSGQSWTKRAAIPLPIGAPRQYASDV